ncbi:PE-PGRS family protein [Streptomyces sp. SID3343]|uniref:5-methylcytosine restriction system specificity protein McrC n=1 Tax=Streptomyces sp. SID3343 TaxID=2690260 RepID=UPI00136D66E6|nr:PE-PGRS family protein [Streptomyces sp. SID3343]MYW06468.1 PE-PGRS family protein [Streptomyces sp. SID3343]
MSRALENIEICEHESRDLTEQQLTPADVTFLRKWEEKTKRAAPIRYRESRKGWLVTARARAGILALERTRLILRPKAGFGVRPDRLLDWLSYAVGVPIRHPLTERDWHTSELGYAGIVAAGLVEECRLLLRGGLRRGYVPRAVVESRIHGRLDVMAQVTRRYGQVDRIHSRSFVRDPDIWENQVCASALRYVARSTPDKRLGRDAADMLWHFPRAAPMAEAARRLTVARYDPLNAHYQPAHTWARLLLNGGGVEQLLTDQGLPNGSIVINMDVLWEKAVRQLSADAALALGGHRMHALPPIQVNYDVTTHPPFRPDVLVTLPSTRAGTAIPIDAKYKKLAHIGLGSADVHQLLTYIAGHCDPDKAHAVVVYPAPDGRIRRTIEIKGPFGVLGTIELVGVDTREPPGEAAIEQLANALRRVNGGATGP